MVMVWNGHELPDMLLGGAKIWNFTQAETPPGWIHVMTYFMKSPAVPMLIQLNFGVDVPLRI